jgi:hypothetical protein
VSVSAHIIAEGLVRIPEHAGEWFASRHRPISARREGNCSLVRLTVPIGPKTSRTVTVQIELADRHQRLRELGRQVPS